MSHFTVLVVGDDVEKALAPFHEYECTGEDNEYVVEVDQTEEARAEYAKATERRYKDPEGNLHDPYTADGDAKPEFYREPTDAEKEEHGSMMGSGCGGGICWMSKDWGDGKGYRAKVSYLPEGWSEVEVPRNSVETFAEFVDEWYGHSVVPFGTEPDLEDEHKYGYTLVDEAGEVIKTIDRTNPNAKWDWYKIGGRWNGFFKLKDGTLGLLGEPGLQTMNSDYEPVKGNRADQCIKSDIDVDGMRDEAAQKAAESYDLVKSVIGELPRHLSWKEVQRLFPLDGVDRDGEPKVDWDAARKYYGAQEAVMALRSNKETLWLEADNYLIPREQYVDNARRNAISTFAIIKDGKWYERGEMGWWGVVRDEKERDQWTMQFSMLIDSLPDETLLTVVDCHI